MKSLSRWLFIAGLAWAGCGDSGNNNADLSQAPVKICTPDEKTCLDTHTASVCTSDGLSRLSVPCQIGEKCDGGSCVIDTKAPCTSFENGCMDASTALRCSSTGLGFDVVTCPAGTTCTGAGLCEGGCIVGSSSCFDTTHVSTCMDGKTFTTTACDAGKNCVATGSDPYPTAACTASDCTPDPNGCDFVCGNKADPGAANQDKTMSSCVETSNGYKWVAVTCPGVTTCNPSGQACSNGPGAQADCTSDCTPGETRCSDQVSIQTCGTDGKWAASVACNANPLAASLSCFSNLTTNNKAVCGDLVCENGVGACDDTGKFHACGSDGKVAADGTACTTGACVNDSSSSPGKWVAGSCKTECNAGDERCVGGTGSSTYEACVNGLWGPPTQCATGTCWDTKSATGAPRHYCGECVPGSHACAGDQIRTCDNAGTLGAAADCTAGVCVNPPNGGDSVCLAQCFPGKKLCLGNDVTVPGVNIPATDAEATCTPEGRIPASTACGAGTYCRRGPSTDADNSNPGSGTPLGCVVCVGTQNEFGLVDTKCGDDAGTGSGNFLTTCLANSSGWDGANNVNCTGATPTCTPPTNNVSIPAISGPHCLELFPGLLATESGLAAYCASNGCPPPPDGVHYCSFFGNPANESCPTASGLPASDCCVDACVADPTPQPASCQP